VEYDLEDAVQDESTIEALSG